LARLTGRAGRGVFGPINEADVHALAEVIATHVPGDDAHATLYARLDPAVNRFKTLPEKDQDSFRDAVNVGEHGTCREIATKSAEAISVSRA